MARKRKHKSKVRKVYVKAKRVHHRSKSIFGSMGGLVPPNAVMAVGGALAGATALTWANNRLGLSTRFNSPWGTVAALGGLSIAGYFILKRVAPRPVANSVAIGGLITTAAASMAVISGAVQSHQQAASSAGSASLLNRLVSSVPQLPGLTGMEDYSVGDEQGMGEIDYEAQNMSAY